MSNSSNNNATNEKPSTSGTKQALILVLAALTVIAVSIFSTVLVKEIGLSDQASSRYAYRGYSLEEAQKECDAHARQQMGRRLRVLSLDLHSTRTDEAEGRHKVFFKAEAFVDERRTGVPEEFFVTCYTRTNEPGVTGFNMAKDEEFVPQAVRRRNGNPFGI